MLAFQGFKDGEVQDFSGAYRLFKGLRRARTHLTLLWWRAIKCHVEVPRNTRPQVWELEDAPDFRAASAGR